MDAAKIVKRIRALSGITRTELAALAELAPSTIGRIEKGALDPTWGTLSRILEATGYRIHGDTVVSAGDATAITAARPLFESLAAPGRAVMSDTAAVVNPWLGRWARAGWLTEQTEADDLVSVAIAAGNAGKIARRNVARRSVAAYDGWRALARRLEEARIDYAVSGLIAVRRDRATATVASPVIYVENPTQVVAELGLEDAMPGRGVLLLAPSGDEFARTEVDGGIRFVSQAQGVLDAFAGSGREPDKAEDTLRALLGVGA